MVESRQEELRDRSLAELVRELGNDTATLVRQEVELAKAELSEKASKAVRGAAMFGAAAGFGIAAFAAFVAFVILALALAMAGWAAALVALAIFAVVGGASAILGLKQFRKAFPPVPEQTMETVREDIEWAKHAAGRKDGHGEDREPVGSSGRRSS